MDVIIHYHEVPKLERELLFGEDDHLKEHSLDSRFLQGQITMVDLGGHMVGRPFS
jgi:hypothetical protein